MRETATAKAGVVTAMAAAMALLPVVGTACGACVFAQVERDFPPAGPWSLVGTMLFLAIAVSVRPFSDDGSVAKNATFAVCAIVGGFLLGAWAMGPFPLMALGLLGFYGIGRLLRYRVDPTFEDRFRRGVILGSIAGVLLLGTAVWKYVEASQWDTADQVLRYGGTPTGRSEMRKLLDEGDVAQIRKVVAAGTSIEALKAAETLGEIGEPSIDAPLLLGAMARIREGQWSWMYRDYEKALGALLGVETEEGRTLEEWEALVGSLPDDDAPDAEDAP